MLKWFYYGLLFYYYFWRQGLTVYPWPICRLIHRMGWPQIYRVPTPECWDESHVPLYPAIKHGTSLFMNVWWLMMDWPRTCNSFGFLALGFVFLFCFKRGSHETQTGFKLNICSWGWSWTSGPPASTKSWDYRATIYPTQCLGFLSPYLLQEKCQEMTAGMQARFSAAFWGCVLKEGSGLRYRKRWYLFTESAAVYFTCMHVCV